MYVRIRICVCVHLTSAGKSPAVQTLGTSALKPLILALTLPISAALMQNVFCSESETNIYFQGNFPAREWVGKMGISYNELSLA